MRTSLNPPMLLKTLINSLKTMNDSGKLTYLINQLNKRETASPAEAYVFILTCAQSYPLIRKHPYWPQVQKLWEDCYAQCQPGEIWEVVERQNAPIKSFFNNFLLSSLETNKELKADKTPAKQPKKTR